MKLTKDYTKVRIAASEAWWNGVVKDLQKWIINEWREMVGEDRPEGESHQIRLQPYIDSVDYAMQYAIIVNTQGTSITPAQIVELLEPKLWEMGIQAKALPEYQTEDEGLINTFVPYPGYEQQAIRTYGSDSITVKQPYAG